MTRVHAEAFDMAAVLEAANLRAAIAEARLDIALHNLEKMRDMYHELALRLATPAVPVPAVVEAIGDVEVPPDEVMAAMKAISPIRDKTYDANWAYWEANKEKARLHPVAFAAEIIDGAGV